MGSVDLVVGVDDGVGDAASIGDLVPVGAGPFADLVKILFGASQLSGRLRAVDLSGYFDERLEALF